jgi:inhibitor of KinA
MPDQDAFPRFRPVAGHAVLVEFGEVIDPEVHAQVRRLDAALLAAPFPGFREAVPAYASVLVAFDPLECDHEDVRRIVKTLLGTPSTSRREAVSHDVLVCYDHDLGPDLQGVAERLGMAEDAVISAHLAGDYSVFLYGFAPGFAYLAGVPEAIRLPRKPAPVRGIPAGSVLMAGPQCLVTTLTMPTGWWIIGRSPTRILQDETSTKPFLFDVGDLVRFRRIDRATFDQLAQQG